VHDDDYQLSVSKIFSPGALYDSGIRGIVGK
jgi:hypothetical protein